MSVGWHHEGHHVALSKAWSRWTQPARLCPQLCSKLFPRIAAAAARRGTAGLRLRRVFESGGFLCAGSTATSQECCQGWHALDSMRGGSRLQHFLHSAAGFLPRSVARGCLEWDVLNPVTCCLPSPPNIVTRNTRVQLLATRKSGQGAPKETCKMGPPSNTYPESKNKSYSKHLFPATQANVTKTASLKHILRSASIEAS